MAEFCAQCAKELDFDTDFAGFTTKDDTAAGIVTTHVLCEGCGFIQVDHTGYCLGCLTHPHLTTEEVKARAAL